MHITFNSKKTAFIAAFDGADKKTIKAIAEEAWKNAKMADICDGSHDGFVTGGGIAWDGWEEAKETTAAYANAIIAACQKRKISIKK